MSRVRPVILCGGKGQRLWPLSTSAVPKPFHKLISGRTLFEESVMRVMGASQGVGFLDPLIVAGQGMEELVNAGVQSIGAKPAAILLEPEGKNTAAAIALAALAAEQLENQPSLMLVLPSDHFINPVDAFRETIAKAVALAEQGEIVVFGIPPTKPETGYGYIKTGHQLGSGFKVDAFEEKPDFKTAERYLETGDRLWNSGMFLFRTDILLAELGRHEPEILAVTRQALGPDGRIDAEVFAGCKSLPIDIAVMEKTDRAAVVPVNFNWSDIGTWDALSEAKSADKNGNVLEGDVRQIGSTGNYLRADGVRLGVVGLEGMIVVATQDATLIVPKGRSGDIKPLLDE